MRIRERRDHLSEVWREGYPTKERNLEIYMARQEGLTYKAIGDKYGITSERAIQICRKVKRCIERYGE